MDSSINLTSILQEFDNMLVSSDCPREITPNHWHILLDLIKIGLIPIFEHIHLYAVNNIRWIVSRDNTWSWKNTGWSNCKHNASICD